MRISTTQRSAKGRGRASWLAALGTIGAFALVAPAAPAASLDRSSQDLTGVSVACGDTVLTFTGGVQVGDLHRVLLGNGNEVVILDVVLHDATLADATGSTYRAVGGANSSARVTTENDAAAPAGHFIVTITVLGEGGRVGMVMLRERTARDGTVDLVTGGGCSL